MFILQIENENKNIINLTQNMSNYIVTHIDGVNPPQADLYTSTVANLDGARFKSSKLQMRNIVITVKIVGDIETNRINLYQYFRPGRYCKIYYKNGSRNLYIEGYCESVETDLFTISQEMQISIVCTDPYFKSIFEIYADISKSLGVFEFPFAIDIDGIEFENIDPERKMIIVNSGETESGLIITMTALINNIVDPVIYDLNKNKFIKLNMTLNEGDSVTINTNKGQKKAFKMSNGVQTSVINNIQYGSEWLQLSIGENIFSYNASNNEDFLKVELKSNKLFEGV